MKLVVIESPYAGCVDRNIEYARRALKDSIDRGEAPIASHLLYTQVLDDLDMPDRVKGIRAGFAWNVHADVVAVYADYGVSDGMAVGVELAVDHGIPVVYRRIGEN